MMIRCTRGCRAETERTSGMESGPNVPAVFARQISSQRLSKKYWSNELNGVWHVRTWLSRSPSPICAQNNMSNKQRAMEGHEAERHPCRLSFSFVDSPLPEFR